MLPAAHRLRSGRHIRTVSRTGARYSSGFLTVHIATDSASVHPPRAAFVVTKAVGSSVTRNRVQRRLRHLMAGYLSSFVNGTDVVVRARPGAATATSLQLSKDLSAALRKAGAL